MNREERVKLLFRTISDIAGFEIKPNKEFYVVINGHRIKHFMTENLALMQWQLKGYYERSDDTVLHIFNGDYKLEEPIELLTDEEKEFLRQFKFEELEISNYLYMYDKTGLIVNVIHLNTINFSFDGLEKGKKYSGKELGL